MKILRGLDWPDALEAGVTVFLGTVLFLGVVVGMPVAMSSALFEASRPVAAVGVLALSGVLLAACVRDALRRRWSAISGAGVGVWIVCVLYAAIRVLG